MDGRRGPTPPAPQSGGLRADDSEELDVFTAERYFSGALTAEDAVWCDRSSSSFSSVFKTGQQEGSAPTPTAGTSSSEASWNRHSALLPNRPVVATAAPAVETKPSRTTSGHTGRKPSSSSHLRRWLLGVAGCACAGGDGDESVSAADLCPDEVDAGSALCGKRCSTDADAMLPRRTSKQTAVEEEVTTVRVRPGKWVDDDGDAFLAGMATLPPLQLAEPGNRLAANSGELSMRMLNPTTTASYDDERRSLSFDMFRQASHGSTLVPAKQNSTFTVVAGSTARGGDRGIPDPPQGGCGSRRYSGVDDAAPSELECMSPPSEVSVVWSVVTADGAASGNFPSAASGFYYYYLNDGHEEALRHTAAGAKSNRRSGNRSGLLMGCISERAVDIPAIGPPRTSVHRRPGRG